MSEEILINVTLHETRVAVVENGMLQDLYIERTRQRGLVGNIYKGKTARVLPGMQAAFIDIGLARNGFLHVSDIARTVEDLEIEQQAGTPKSIEEALHEGQDILVQVIKDPLGSKGARLTTRLSIPSRYLVYIPDDALIAIAQRIEAAEERERLRSAIVDHQAHINSGLDDTQDIGQDAGADIGQNTNKGGFIIRTAAEGVAAGRLQKDMDFLCKLWQTTCIRAQNASAPGLVYEDLPLALRAMRDLIHDEIEKVRVDSQETYQQLLAFSKQFNPAFASRIEYYPGERPILDIYSVEDEVQKALNRKVQLKSGGHLVIDQTEAMTTFDVNTGAFVGHRNFEETIYKTNLEAVQTIARQLRLRNLGGIIIIDFIDMQEAEHERQVLRTLEKNIAKDHAKVSISEMTSLGLVQLTRKRTRESLEHILCEPCPSCKGRGSIKTAESVCYEIFRDILREVRQFDAQKLLVVATQVIVDRLMDEESAGVAELETSIGRPITFQVEPLYSQEQYDIVLL